MIGWPVRKSISAHHVGITFLVPNFFSLSSYLAERFFSRSMTSSKLYFTLYLHSLLFHQISSSPKKDESYVLNKEQLSCQLFSYSFLTLFQYFLYFLNAL